MLRNTKILYGIISVLLVICMLCGIHIAKDRAMMYENRAYIVTETSALSEGVLGWITSAVEAENPDDISSSISNAKIYLESLIEITSIGGRGVYKYNILLKEKSYGIPGMFSHDLRDIELRLDEIQRNLSENGKLSEEDLAYLKAAEEAFGYLFERLETDGVINEDAVKSDTYIANVCGNFCYMMLNK
ncbi:MAG: hypothetical protein IJ306_06300 [Oscillospiraceae bacterium]|nr:hypothetical protein [Oscillospiraceae bacterium]